jgi:hypothetical protein
MSSSPPQPTTPVQPATRRRILIVEDEPDIARGLTDALGTAVASGLAIADVLTSGVGLVAALF